MKFRVISVVVALSLSFASGVLIGGSSHQSTSANAASQTLDPAYRDGLYQAKLDARQGRRPHLAVGRWSTQSARASYVAGYQEGYRQAVGSPAGSLNEFSVAQLAASGFHDGMLDGAWHRLSSLPFQAEQTPHYRDAGLSLVDAPANTDVIQHFYREAYLHGYQQAYYSSSK
jgi:hypothetical protein